MANALHVVADARQCADWWPASAGDPRDRLAWAVGARWEGDGIFFGGAPRGPALWLRPEHSTTGSTRMNAVDVCGGLYRGAPQDVADIEAARAAAPRQLVIANNGYGSALAGWASASPARTRAVLAAACEVADDDGRVPVLLHCPDNDPLLSELAPLGFAAGVTDVYPAIDLPGSSIDDYVAALPRQRRVGIRREIRAGQEADCNILCGAEAASHIPAAAALVSTAYDARGQYISVDKVAGIFRGLLAAFDKDFLLSMVFAEGVPVASACLVAGDDSLLLWFAGLDPQLSRPVAGYFNAAYYQPIAYAYAHGQRHLLLGPGGTETKRRRGARFSPMWSAVPARCAPLVAMLRGTDAWTRQRLAELCP